MLLAVFVVCVGALATSTLLLLSIGRSVPFASRIVSLLIGASFVLAAGEVAARIWRLPTAPVWGAEVLLALPIGCLVILRPRWNPVAHLFAGSALATSLAYLAFGLSLRHLRSSLQGALLRLVVELVVRATSWSRVRAKATSAAGRDVLCR